MMKNYKRIISVLCVVLMASLSMFYQNGPGQGGENVTGAPFDNGSCNNCHGGGSFGTSVNVQLLSGATPVTTYLPGASYTLRITINGTGGSAYGFQTTAAFQGSNNNINTWGALAGTHNALLSGRNYMEHDAPLGGNVINIPWTGPASTQPIVFYAAGNIVNLDGGTSGDQSNTGSLTVTSGCTPITITPNTLPNATAGSAYNQALSSNGVAPVTYVIATGALPTGITLSSAGVLSGTTANPGTYNFTVTATGSNGCSSTQSFTLVVNCPTITLTPASPLPQGTVGTAYNQVISQTGGSGTFTYSVTAGTLPNGVTLNMNGTLSGTPLVAGTYNFTITGTNGTCSGVTAYTLVIGCPTITLNPSTLPNGTLGVGYGQFITQSGGGSGPYTFTVSSGTLPNGLTLNTNGSLSGTPTATGTFTFTVLATGTQSTCTGTRTYTIIIGCPTITINPATITTLNPGANVNVPFSQTGGSGVFTYAHTSGTLPTGLSVTGGALTGIPTATGSYTFTITGTGPLPDLCTGTRTYTVTVACPTISLSPMSPLPVGNEGFAYSQAITVTGSANTFTFTLTAGTLPAGLTLNANGSLSGTPDPGSAGTYNFTITALDIYGCTTSTAYTLVISPCPPITLSPTTLPNGTVLTAYNQVITQTGGTNPVYSSSGTLPPGITLTAGGILSGTPNVPGTYMFTIIVDADGGCSGSQAYTVVIDCPNITLSPGTLPVDTVGQAYNEVITQSGSVGTTFDYTVTSGTLPPGITLALDGTFSGTGTATGIYTFDVTMEDDLGCSVTVTYTIEVVCPVIAIDQTEVDTVFTSTPYTTTLTQTGGAAPYTYTVTSGTLPGGITLGTDGVLSGTSTDLGTFTITVTVTDANGCTATQVFIIVVSDPVSVVEVSADKESVVLLPNIVTNNTTALIVTNSSMKAELRVIDITGKVVYHNMVHLHAGENRISLDLQELAAGSYTLHVRPLRVAPVRFIKQ